MRTAHRGARRTAGRADRAVLRRTGSRRAQPSTLLRLAPLGAVTPHMHGPGGGAAGMSASGVVAPDSRGAPRGGGATAGAAPAAAAAAAAGAAQNDTWDVWWCFDGWHPLRERCAPRAAGGWGWGVKTKPAASLWPGRRGTAQHTPLRMARWQRRVRQRMPGASLHPPMRHRLEPLLPPWARLRMLDPARPLHEQCRGAKVCRRGGKRRAPQPCPPRVHSQRSAPSGALACSCSHSTDVARTDASPPSDPTPGTAASPFRAPPLPPPGAHPHNGRRRRRGHRGGGRPAAHRAAGGGVRRPNQIAAAAGRACGAPRAPRRVCCGAAAACAPKAPPAPPLEQPCRCDPGRYANIDIHAAEKRGVPVTIAPGARAASQPAIQRLPRRARAQAAWGWVGRGRRILLRARGQAAAGPLMTCGARARRPPSHPRPAPRPATGPLRAVLFPGAWLQQPSPHPIPPPPPTPGRGPTGFNSQSTAEAALLLILMLARRVGEAHAAFRERRIGEPGAPAHAQGLPPPSPPPMAPWG